MVITYSYDWSLWYQQTLCLLLLLKALIKQLVSQSSALAKATKHLFEQPFLDGRKHPAPSLPAESKIGPTCLHGLILITHSSKVGVCSQNNSGRQNLPRIVLWRWSLGQPTLTLLNTFNPQNQGVYTQAACWDPFLAHTHGRTQPGKWAGDSFNN